MESYSSLLDNPQAARAAGSLSGPAGFSSLVFWFFYIRRLIFIFADINRLTTNILPFVMMNKCLTTLAFCLISFACFGQQFTCEKLEETVTRWNETRASLSSDSSTIDWAQAVIDNKVYSFNEKNEMGYDFIIHSSDTLDFDRLKEVTIDYLQFYMNLNQRDRESVVQSSLDRSVFYQSYYYNLAVQTGVVQVGVFSVYSQVYFEFKSFTTRQNWLKGFILSDFCIPFRPEKVCLNSKKNRRLKPSSMYIADHSITRNSIWTGLTAAMQKMSPPMTTIGDTLIFWRRGE